MALEESKDLAQKINDFLLQNRKIVLGALACILIAVAGTVIWFITAENSRKSSVTSVEKIIYELEEFKREDRAKNPPADEASQETEKNVSEAVKEAENKAIEELKPLGEKYASSYAGFRANTAIAEIYFQRKMYEDALKFYELAANAVKNSYVEGVACFNAAACADEMGVNEKALAYYERASKVENFPLVPRAIFNTGRLYETLSKKDEAIVSYNRLLEKYPQDEWALLAKSRIIVLTGSDAN
ncbi:MULTISPECIES: tetratricopeptide repeat protein [unclassified Treponema]|uniref:tetratricopeptide repeat protein n=1 Tax=unclassified Treponema TaxID=2638727 RepID=UPI0020A37C3B|nr:MULTISPECIES: tetratricopeptide repeat protein [unclassified Treponema]UTC67700.1 tetratricopeptide repeat protein [Treponema sp. OMZ 789]UTC70428.1 tetratricopeptide repeat protein [Treponema sp. OMZ 790]UTC73141.1 tetratricopeptide repeat protein [Treponema sp. OMZ 791]